MSRSPTPRSDPADSTLLSENPSAIHSSNSSFTYCEPSASKSTSDVVLTDGIAKQHPISEIAQRGEEELERYGGDDIHDPLPHDHLPEVGCTLPPPPRQKAFNVKTMKTEPIKLWHPLTFYDSGEARAPLKKCTEWVEQDAIPALLEHGILEQIL